MADHDVIVVGAGPSGSACAYWLAEAGHDVLLVEKKHFPREKTCGDGLTPRAVKQLDDMGLADQLSHHHRFHGLRSIAFGRTLELEWPATPGFPTHGYVVTRHDLDAMVAERAEKAGAVLWQDTEAVAPIVDRGLVRGAVLQRKSGGAPEEVRARYLVVADGANSRFGRSLGTSRDRSYPQGMAIRGYFTSPRHDEPWIESHLDVRDANGNVLPGYGWIFPVGDGRVNVGVGLLSTFNQWKQVNTTKLMDAFVDWAPASWGISPATSCGPATGGRLPMGLSVGPHAGPTYLVVGDAAGAINPFNGEGIAYAYETGRFAAEAVALALTTDDGLALTTYDERLKAEYDLYYKVARAFVRIIGRPELMRVLVGTGMHSRTLMEWVLRIMANLLRPDELGPAEAAYRAVAALARVA
ncbi:MAG: geranylgeranyl reductase family protein [Acidimicrobiales bacterium]|jgi:geranylgeranyl reductase family protein|nr:geranylgeranyl reductase family protein [Acidimicrobiales bacterium]